MPNQEYHTKTTTTEEAPVVTAIKTLMRGLGSMTTETSVHAAGYLLVFTKLGGIQDEIRLLRLALEAQHVGNADTVEPEP